MLHRIWHHGYVVIDKQRRPLEVLRKYIVAGARDRVAVADLGDHDAKNASHCNLAFTWTRSEGVRFGALLALRVDETDPRHVNWFLGAACSRPWGISYKAPLDHLGLIAGEWMAKDYSGAVLHSLAIPCHDLQSDLVDCFADDVAGVINDPHRSVGFLLLPQDDPPDSIGWPGLVSALAIDETQRRAINARLPITRTIEPNQARLFAPACDQIPDTLGQTFPFGLCRSIYTAMNQLIWARQQTPLPPRWSQDDAVQHWWANDPYTLPRQGPCARLATPAPSSSSAETDRKLAILRKQHSACQAELKQAREANLKLRTQLQQQSVPAEVDGVLGQLEALQNTLDQYIQEYEILEAELDRLRREYGLMATELTAHHQHPDSGIEQDRDPAEFPTFQDLLTAARTTLPGLVITAALEPAAALDRHPKANAWRRKAWDALRTLSAYAAARNSGHGGPEYADVLAYVRSGQPGSFISANIIALGESEAVNANGRCRAARIFPVNVDSDPIELAFFGAHIVLDKFRSPAPRIHFLDRGTQVYVGYIGEHLPTLKTN